MIDLFSPRVMIPALREIKPVRQFLRDTFFPASTERTYRVENIDIDVQEGSRRVAPFVNKWAPGKLVERRGFETRNQAPPCIAMKMPITVQDISTRAMGENVYENMDPAQRGQILLADDMRELKDMLARRLEIMVRDAIYDSEIVVSGEDTGMTITFPRKAALEIGTLTGTSVWDNAASDPIAQIDELAELYSAETGYTADFALLGSLAYRALISNVKVKAALNILRGLDLGSIAPKILPNGVRYVGEFAGTGIPLYTYNEYYTDPADPDQEDRLPMVPTKSLMIASTSLRNEMRYGAVQDLTDGTDNAMPTLVESPALPRSWVVKDPPVRWLELRSRPLPVPIQNYFLTCQVLT